MTGNNKAQYFDLHTNGFGFFNRIRQVTPRKGHPFWSVTVAACRGDDNEKTFFDCNVVGKEAIALFEQHLTDIGKDDVVTASVVMSDQYVDTFTYPSDHTKAGQQGYSLKARLIRIKYLKINDSVVYKTEPKSLEAA
ncbi:hypothetical protein MACH09_45220 [Vibrio sp. MACH09]|uniref:DUF3577 domain-containing protein n=1 Tax=Vibrio sp. MACH09 TaxID=3025122 RepID=UPI002794AAAB|nr:DUF3577 domain-containing protein [Vibrio sp. MACH09]GLO64014.1 hypothetical protein MACH09_45220 [Vibrio sp. MACH09]